MLRPNSMVYDSTTHDVQPVALCSPAAYAGDVESKIVAANLLCTTSFGDEFNAGISLTRFTQYRCSSFGRQTFGWHGAFNSLAYHVGCGR